MGQRERPVMAGMALVVCVLLGSACLPCLGQAPPSAQEILRRALDLSREVQDYSASLTIAADIRGAPETIPSLKVYFKRPDKVHVESRSIVIVRRDMLTFGNLSKAVEGGADVALVGTKTVDGAPWYTVKLIPRGSQPHEAPRTLITVDGQRWQVRRTEIYQGAERQAVMDWSYVLVGGRYWMPSTIRCALPRIQGRDSRPGAELSVTFSDYRVNTGLPDSLFAASQQ